jgi:hypothetical protein
LLFVNKKKRKRRKQMNKKPYEQRRTEKLIDGEWTECDFSSLKKNDTFRSFEPTGEPVEHKGYSIFTAVGDAYERNGVGTIDIADVEEETND